MDEKPTYEELEQRVEKLERENLHLRQAERELIHRIELLTRPLHNDETIKFEDLFNLDDIQRIQDEFAQVTGIASIITHTDGRPITTPSNFCRMCRDLIRKTDKGLKNCFKSDAALGRARADGPTIQPCMSSGLWDAGAGITFGGKHIANWLIGQVRDESQSEKNILAYAREIGAPEKEMLEAFREVTPMPHEQFERIARFLFTFVNQLSTTAYQIVQQARFISEIKQAKQALAESEGKLRSTLDATPFPVAIVDSQGDKIFYWSQSALALFGYTASTVAEWYQTAYPDAESKRQALENWESFLEEARQSRVPVNTGEYRITCKDGSVCICEIYATFLPDNLIVTFNDITQRRRAELELQAREATLNSIFLSAPVGIGMAVDRNIVWANQRLCYMIGASVDELIHQSARVLYPDQEEFERVGHAAYDQVYEKGIGTFETRWCRKNGDIFDVLLRIAPLEPSDMSKGFIFTGLDINERKKAAKALQESEERFRITFLTSPDAITISRIKDGIYIDSNEGFIRVMGYSREEVIGKSVFELNIWKNFDDRRRLVRGLSQNGYVENLEAQFVRKDGTVVVGLMSANIIQIQGESAILSVTRDISKRKKTENELRAYREHLEELVKKRTAALESKNKELETFTYSVSHDLKAPLRGIDGYSRLLEEEYSDRFDDEGKLFLKNVRQGADQMNQLIEDLLAYSRMERRSLQPMPIDLQSMIDLLISQRARDLEARHIRMCVNLPFQTIHSDTETLRQVLANYLDNAVKFSCDGGPAMIEISGRENSDTWTLWVKDNGIGFDPRYHDRIFEIFQRLHRAEDFPGTGIGLAIVLKAVERIGGRVWAESTPGKGAAFFVEIPKG